MKLFSLISHLNLLKVYKMLKKEELEYMKNAITSLVMLLCLNGYAEYPLKNVVKDAVEKSNIIKIYYYKIEEAQHSVKEADYIKYGGLNLKATYTNGDEPVYVFASKMRQGIFKMADMMNINNPDSIDNLEIGIEAGVPLFTGFKIQNYQKISDLNLKANKKIYEEVKNGIKFQSLYSYLTAVMYREMVKISSQAISSSEIELDSAKRLNEKGMIFGSDYYAALSIYEFLKKTYSESYQSFLREIETLSVLTEKVISDRDINASLKEMDFRIEPVDYYINLALQSRNSIKAYDDFIKIKETQKDMQKNSILPDIMAFASFTANSGKISDMKTSSVYGIKLNFPIGDPAYFERIKKSEDEINQTEEMKKDEIRKLTDEIKRTYNDLISSKKSIDITKKSVENAEKSVELFKPLYRQGKQSIMEVLRAESNLLQAKAAYYEAVFKYSIFYIKLRYLSDTLDDNFIEDFSDRISK